jgi:hypothetical protein
MKRLFLILVIFVLFSGFVSSDTGEVGDCVVTNAASCPSGQSTFLWLSDVTNAHVSKIEFQGDYSYKLCCDTQLEGTDIVPLGVYSNENSHVSNFKNIGAFSFNSDYECGFYSYNGIPGNTFCVLRLHTVENSHVESCDYGSGLYPVVLACFEDGDVPPEEDLFCADIVEGASCGDPGCSFDDIETIYPAATDCGDMVCHVCSPPPDPAEYCSLADGHECESNQNCIDDNGQGYYCTSYPGCTCDLNYNPAPNDPCSGEYIYSGECLLCNANSPIACGSTDGYFVQEHFFYELNQEEGNAEGLDCDGTTGFLNCVQSEEGEEDANCEDYFFDHGYCFLNVDEDVPFFDYFSVIFALVLITSYYVYNRKRKDL